MINASFIRKLPSILSRILIIIIMLVSIIVVSNNILEYRAVTNNVNNLKNDYQNKVNQVDEIEHYLKSDVDSEYKELMARLLGYCYPDEIVYYID